MATKKIHPPVVTGASESTGSSTSHHDSTTVDLLSPKKVTKKRSLPGDNGNCSSFSDDAEESPRSLPSPSKKVVVADTKEDTSRMRKKKKKRALKFQDNLLSISRDAEYTGSVVVDTASNISLSASSSTPPSIPSTIHITTSSIFPLATNRRPFHHVRTNDDNRHSAIQIYTQPLLVLDLNGILCHRVRYHKEPQGVAISYRPATVHIANTPVIPRPHLADFLTFLDSHFCLAVWTSATAKTAKKLVEELFPVHVAAKLLFVWGQNRCKASQVDGRGEVLFEKELDKVWSEFPLWNQFSTLLVDDSPDKCPFQYNALHPPPLHGQCQQPCTHAAAAAAGLLNSTTNKNTWMSDEENDQLQMDFFQKLVEFWKKNHSIISWNEVGDIQCNQHSDALRTFLGENGVDHMGWRI